MNEPFMLSILKQQESIKDSRKKISAFTQKKDSISQVLNTQNSGQSKRLVSKEAQRTSLNVNVTSQMLKTHVSQSNNASVIIDNKVKTKEEVFLLNQPKPYLGGTQFHKVFVNIRQLTFEEKQVQQSQDRPSLLILNPTTINFNNINIDPKKKKIVQKEKSYTFDYVQGEGANNQSLHKKAISPLIQKFVAGTNQSILVFGGESSGKTQTLVGGMRDPGMFVLSLEEMFDILYQSPDRENTTLKMSMYYNHGSYFYDLLVNHKFPHKLYEKENGEVFPLGISEIIVTSLRTSLKILKIGLDNIENSEMIKREGNVILSFKCERSENILVSQDTIYSTLKIIKMSDGSYEEINEQKDECMMSNLMNCLRQLSKMSNKKKNAIIPYRKHIFTEYLRESLIGNSNTSIVCCLSNAQKRVNDTANILRLGNACKKILTNPKDVKNSHAQQQNIYNDTLENIGNTISIWLKEFWGEIEKSKHRRLKIIFKILRTLERFMYVLLDGLEQQIQIDLIKNALYAKILDMHCKVYSESITSEDIKEFYIAKIQTYAQKQLNEQFEQIYPSIHFVLQQLEDGKERIIKNRNKLNSFLRHYAEVKKVSQNGSALKDLQNQVPPDIKITPLLLLNVQSLTNLDIEKMGFLQKLFSKFQENCENLIELNQYIPQTVRADIADCLKDYKFLEKTLIEDGINATEESNMNTSRMSFRFNASMFKPSNKMRNSTFKLQYETQSRSRLNSQQIIINLNY